MKTKEYIAPECFAVACIEAGDAILTGSSVAIEDYMVEDYMIDDSKVEWI